jgi:hypothetical protein
MGTLGRPTSTLSPSNIRRPNLYKRPSKRHRTHRVRTSVILLALVLTAAGTWWFGFREDAAAKDRVALDCPPAPAALPAPATVTVNVFNATGRKGFAAATAAELRKRGFVIGKVANDPLRRTLTGVGEVRGATKNRNQITVVAAYAESIIKLEDAKRKDSTIDLTLGARFTVLRTTAQAQAILNPPPPPGCAPRPAAPPRA